MDILTTKEITIDGVTHRIKAIKDDFIKAKKLNQLEIVLLHLLYIGYITVKQCANAYGFNHCPKIIENIEKKYGVVIERYKQKGLNIKNRYGQKTEYVEYHIKNPQMLREALL